MAQSPSSPVAPFLKILDILQSERANEEINFLGNNSFMGEVRDQRKGPSLVAGHCLSYHSQAVSRQ